MSSIEGLLADASEIIWGPYLLIPLLLCTGLYLTFMLRGLQFRQLGPSLWFALIRRRDDSTDGDVTHFQALTTALAATVGVGNIAGVATAIHLGGPGALFWMWFTGLVGMATKYSEAFLGVRFRRTDAKGEQSGGPMFYLSEGIRGPLGAVLGVSFALFAVFASFGIGNMTQSNTVATQFDSSFDIPVVATAIVLTIGAAAVIIGGIKSIGRFTSAFVPIMIVLYVGGAIVVLAANITDLPGAIGLIVSDAFTGTAAAGGFGGAAFLAALRYGVARGIFSNESGLGTGGIAAAAAQTTHPVRQALVSMTQTFIDTLVVVTFTGLVIVTTGAWKLGDAYDGAPMTAEAFARGLPGDWGHYIVAISVGFFAFSTLLGWSYYGERCIDRLAGRRWVVPYRLVFVVVIFIGAMAELEVVWMFSDVMNGLMALPNLVGLILLAPLVSRETREYLQDKLVLRR